MPTDNLYAMADDFANRFNSPEGEGIQLCVSYTKDKEAALEFKEEILKRFPDRDIVLDPLSLNIVCHIGPGALAIACAKKI